MKIRLIAPEIIRRVVKKVHHFPRRSKEEINRLDDDRMKKILLKRRRERPYGHDSVLLQCGHVLTKVRTTDGPVLYRSLPCSNCTRRNEEMQVRYVRADLKKKRRAAKLKQRARIVLRPQPKHVLRIKLRRR